MTVLFATLGFTPQAIIPSLKWVQDIEKVMVFHSADERSVSALEGVRAACSAIAVEFGCYMIEDVHSLLSTLEELNRFVEDYKPENIVFNITGGTKMLASAALFLCVLRGIRTIYVNEDNGRVTEVPILRIDYSELLTQRERETLDAIIRMWEKEKETGEEDSSIPLSRVYKELGYGKSVVASYLDRLERKGLIEKFEDEENGRRKKLRLKEGAIFYSYQRRR